MFSRIRLSLSRLLGLKPVWDPETFILETSFFLQYPKCLQTPYFSYSSSTPWLAHSGDQVKIAELASVHYWMLLNGTPEKRANSISSSYAAPCRVVTLFSWPDDMATATVAPGLIMGCAVLNIIVSIGEILGRFFLPSTFLLCIMHLWPRFSYIPFCLLGLNENESSWGWGLPKNKREQQEAHEYQFRRQARDFKHWVINSFGWEHPFLVDARWETNVGRDGANGKIDTAGWGMSIKRQICRQLWNKYDDMTITLHDRVKSHVFYFSHSCISGDTPARWNN